MDEHIEKFNKELENIKKNQQRWRLQITEIKNTWGEINSILDITDQQTERPSRGSHPSLTKINI